MGMITREEADQQYAEVSFWLQDTSSSEEAYFWLEFLDGLLCRMER